MINHQTLQGNWNEIKGRLRSKWGSLTDDDLNVVNGNIEQLIGTIQRKTGEAREGIEQFIEHCRADGESAMNRASDTIRSYAQQASTSVGETTKQAAASMRDGYAEVEEMVRQRPAESLVMCFGVGVVTGVAVSAFLRWR